MLILDADILIDIQRGFAEAVVWLASLNEAPSIPGFVVMELIQDARNGKEVKAALKFVSPYSRVWPSKTDCDLALVQYSKLHLSDNLGLIDALIAAIVVGIPGGELCTFNTKHFKNFPGLVTVQPYKKKK